MIQFLRWVEELARGKGVCGESEKVSQFLGMPRECLLLSEVLQLN